MTMTTTHSHSHRKVDLAGVLLFLIGVASIAGCYWLIEDQGFNPLVMIPAVVAATNGARHFTKLEATRN